jgi:hypothetical protein
MARSSASIGTGRDLNVADDLEPEAVFWSLPVGSSPAWRLRHAGITEHVPGVLVALAEIAGAFGGVVSVEGEIIRGLDNRVIE